MAPDMVRLIMAQGAERLISMRLTMSPEWSAAESVVGAGASTSAKGFGDGGELGLVARVGGESSSESVVVSLIAACV